MKISKLKILIYIIVLVLIVVVYNLYKDNSRPTVTLDTEGPSYNLYLSTEKDRSIATINSKTSMKLRDGYYCTSVSDKKYQNTDQCFVVYKKDTSFTLKLIYSDEYLKNELASQQNTINEVIKTKYSSIINNFVICGGSLYENGALYGTTIREKTAIRNDVTDVYRVVLRKENNTWNIVNTPVLVLDKFTFPDVPVEVLKKINTLTVCQQ